MLWQQDRSPATPEIPDVHRLPYLIDNSVWSMEISVAKNPASFRDDDQTWLVGISEKADVESGLVERQTDIQVVIGNAECDG